MTKIMSKIATSDMIRVIVGQEFSFKENVSGERTARPAAVGSSG